MTHTRSSTSQRRTAKKSEQQWPTTDHRLLNEELRKNLNSHDPHQIIDFSTKNCEKIWTAMTHTRSSTSQRRTAKKSEQPWPTPDHRLLNEELRKNLNSNDPQQIIDFSTKNCEKIWTAMTHTRSSTSQRRTAKKSEQQWPTTDHRLLSHVIFLLSQNDYQIAGLILLFN